MSHVIKTKPKLLARIRRMKGQLEAIENAVLAEKPCGDILNQVASVRGALSGLTAELIEEHLREHIVSADVSDEARAEATEELVDVIRSYLK